MPGISDAAQKSKETVRQLLSFFRDLLYADLIYTGMGDRPQTVSKGGQSGSTPAYWGEKQHGSAGSLNRAAHAVLHPWCQGIVIV